MGLLTVKGTLALDQFWPTGESDADTAKVVVTVAPNAFQFQDDPNRPAKTTHIFDKAKVKGRCGSKPVINTKGRLTVRFQGIDAPELHYQPSPLSRARKAQMTTNQLATFKKLNKRYRQLFGETSTVQLRDLLAGAGQADLPCHITTAVDEPNQVFDIYGRFIGDIHVTLNQQPVNLSQWLVEEGWVYPTFYASMSVSEINALLAATRKGRQKLHRLWKHLRRTVGQFDQALIFRGKGAALNPTADIGSVLMPKLFRRLCTYSVYRKVGIVSGNFHNYLKASNPPDDCFLTADFLDQGSTAAPRHTLDEFVTANGKISKQPHELVFREQPSTLVGLNGKKITTW